MYIAANCVFLESRLLACSNALRVFKAKMSMVYSVVLQRIQCVVLSQSCYHESAVFKKPCIPILGQRGGGLPRLWSGLADAGENDCIAAFSRAACWRLTGSCLSYTGTRKLQLQSVKADPVSDREVRMIVTSLSCCVK